MKKKRVVRIRENSWLAKLAAEKLGFGHVAMVVGHTIHLHNTTTENFFKRKSWVLHELKHVEQYERLGLIRFLWQYLLESRRKGYYNNAFEAEARTAEQESALLDKYDLSAYAFPDNSTA